MERRMIEIYDTTLRDGAQQPGISFSLHDKLAIVQRLDKLGVPFIELGFPGSNPKERGVFEAIRGSPPKRSRIVAFGMTCAKGVRPEDDEGLSAILGADTEFVAIVGKSSRYQVEKVLGASLQENLLMIEQSCMFLAKRGRKVFFDAEHFFDGFAGDQMYSLACLRAAEKGGVALVVLCDTNGGSLPSFVSEAVRAVTSSVNNAVGIHTHNDSELAVANALAAVEAGASHVQVTLNGYGERCGNANLASVAAALKLKMGLECLPDESLAQITELSRFTAEISNRPLPSGQPYVGKLAFCHKGGLHGSAVSKEPNSYHHIPPEAVGNKALVVVSELAGRSNVRLKAEEFGIKLTSTQVAKVLSQVEELESQGFYFEGADGSLMLLMLRQNPDYHQPFEILRRDVSSQRENGREPIDSATVKVKINGTGAIEHHVADGDGPVDALDAALRKALLKHYPCLKKTSLVDYKVRVLDGGKGTAKAVRVLVDFTDGKEEWTTVGCSTDLIEASKWALADGLEYAIYKTKAH